MDSARTVCGERDTSFGDDMHSLREVRAARSWRQSTAYKLSRCVLGNSKNLLIKVLVGKKDFIRNTFYNRRAQNLLFKFGWAKDFKRALQPLWESVHMNTYDFL